MSPFEWKKLINTDQEWTFKGSNTKWNFRNGYQELHYYRSDGTLKFIFSYKLNMVLNIVINK